MPRQGRRIAASHGAEHGRSHREARLGDVAGAGGPLSRLARRQIALFDSADCCGRSEKGSASAAIVSSTA
jgi:hypothetical protein